MHVFSNECVGDRQVAALAAVADDVDGGGSVGGGRWVLGETIRVVEVEAGVAASVAEGVVRPPRTNLDRNVTTFAPHRALKSIV